MFIACSFQQPDAMFQKKDFAQEVSKPIWGFLAFPKWLIENIEKCHSLWKMWTNADFSFNYMKRAAFHSKKNLVDGTNGANVNKLGGPCKHRSCHPVIFTYVYKCQYMRIDEYPPKCMSMKTCINMYNNPILQCQDGIPPASSPRLAPCALRLGCADFRRAVPGGWCPLAARNTMGKNEGFNTFHHNTCQRRIWICTCFHQINIIDYFNCICVLFFKKEQHKWLVWVDIQLWHIWPKGLPKQGPWPWWKTPQGNGTVVNQTVGWTKITKWHINSLDYM